ncbi:MAG: uroporphyrinogen-III synthase [Terracidiphilus sp.]
MSDLPLAGRRILVTRAANQAGKLSEALRALGAEPVEVPVLEIRPPASYEPMDRALRRLDSFDWLILTSANAVRALAERAAQLQIPLALPSSLKVAAIGDATASAARAAGMRITFVPETYVAEILLEGVTEGVAGRRVLIARAAVARDLILDALRAAGAEFEVVDAYQNVLPSSAPDLLAAALAKGLDAATFTSSSSVTHLKEAAGKANIAFPFAGVRAVSIGPITSKTLHELGWPPEAEASVSDIPRLVDAVVSLFSQL